MFAVDIVIHDTYFILDWRLVAGIVSALIVMVAAIAWPLLSRRR